MPFLYFQFPLIPLLHKSFCRFIKKGVLCGQFPTKFKILKVFLCYGARERGTTFKLILLGNFTFVLGMTSIFFPTNFFDHAIFSRILVEKYSWLVNDLGKETRSYFTAWAEIVVSYCQQACALVPLQTVLRWHLYIEMIKQIPLGTFLLYMLNAR